MLNTAWLSQVIVSNTQYKQDKHKLLLLDTNTVSACDMLREIFGKMPNYRPQCLEPEVCEPVTRE